MWFLCDYFICMSLCPQIYTRHQIIVGILCGKGKLRGFYLHCCTILRHLLRWIHNFKTGCKAYPSSYIFFNMKSISLHPFLRMNAWFRLYEPCRAVSNTKHAKMSKKIYASTGNQTSDPRFPAMLHFVILTCFEFPAAWLCRIMTFIRRNPRRKIEI